MSFSFLSGYLETAIPAAMLRLRQTHGSASKLFSSAMVLGADEDQRASGGAVPRDFDRAAAIDLATVSCDQLRKDIDDVLVQMKRRIQRVRRIRFSGGLVTTLSGATGALTALLSRQGEWSQETITLSTAVVTTLSGLCTLFADHFEQTSTGAKFSGSESLPELVEMRAEIEQYRQRAGQDRVFPWSDAELISALDRMNTFSIKIMRYKYVAQD